MDQQQPERASTVAPDKAATVLSALPWGAFVAAFLGVVAVTILVLGQVPLSGLAVFLLYAVPLLAYTAYAAYCLGRHGIALRRRRRRDLAAVAV